MTSTADYDCFADAYVEQNENGLFNAWYERPEMLRLAGNVAGQRVLDAGCGHGPLFEALRSRGAAVSGFDLSPAMVRLARERLGVMSRDVVLAPARNDTVPIQEVSVQTACH